MKIAIVGSRDARADQLDFVCERIDEFLAGFSDRPTIISGGAPGIDKMAEDYARFRSLPTEIHEADWKSLGKAAGPIRNSKIVKTADIVIAFPDKKSKGTWDTVDKALTANKPVYIVPLASMVFNGSTSAFQAEGSGPNPDGRST